MEERRKNSFCTLRSIRSKLFLLRIGIGIVMSISIGTFCYYIISGTLETIRENDLNRDTEIIIDQLRKEVAEHQRVVLDIAKAEPVKKYFNNFSLNMIQSYLTQANIPIDSIGLVDDDGKMDFTLSRGEALLASFDLKTDPDYLRALKSTPGQTLVSAPRFVEELGGFGLVYDCLVTDFFDKRLSFVRGAFDLSRLDNLLPKDKIETAENIFIVSSSGQIIYNSIKLEDLGKEIVGAGGLIEKIWHDERPFGQESFAGYQYKFQRETIPELGWHVMVSADLTNWSRPIITLRNKIMLFSLLLVVLGEFLSRLIGLKISEPITRLNQLAQTIIHSGRIQDRVEWQSMDELGELARSVNNMLDRLEESHDQLIAEKQFVDNVLASVVDGMANCDVNENIITTNNALPQLLGYDFDELFMMPASAILPAEAMITDKDEHQRIADLATDTHFVRLDDTVVPTKGGKKLPVSCTISMIHTHDGAPNGFLIIITDISERKLLEKARNRAETRLRETQEELLKTEKMAVVGQMSGMVAHEVLNPISAVKVRIDLSLPKAQELGKVIEVLSRIVHDWKKQEEAGTMAEYLSGVGKKDLALLGKISDTLAKRQSDRISDLEFLDRQILRIIKIIDNLREMSRQEKTIENIDLAHLLDEVLDDINDGLVKRQITVHREYRARPTIMADYMEVYSIFSNLIKNGMQAIDKQAPGGERSISVTMDSANEQQALVAIRDTGIGMDSSQREEIFSPGFTSKGRQGTGIGTSFARKLARQFGGDIILHESTPGVGSTFHVLLALAEKAQ
ncbi:MAG: ATP-binding protein [Desulfobulbaceae bacterium]|nr:ATP-binding protein [Desulfobulbaceae bacterium]